MEPDAKRQEEAVGEELTRERIAEVARQSLPRISRSDRRSSAPSLGAVAAVGIRLSQASPGAPELHTEARARDAARRKSEKESGFSAPADSAQDSAPGVRRVTYRRGTTKDTSE